MANVKGCTPAQLALAWVLSRGEDIVPIPGCKSLFHLEDNIKALEVSLNPEELDSIDRMLPPGSASGERYAPPQMQAVNR